jgi:hypothetical protein
MPLSQIWPVRTDGCARKPEPAAKQPKEMTSEESLEHLSHPKIAKKARDLAPKPLKRSIEDH